ncbi:hypothetical protein PG991_005333 [Apiospora marii]|uniref:Uncharacterized protein n=1 Tax=Apiospora marii TaxID=335849 RepID=A0ABR1S8W4_9PEZI
MQIPAVICLLMPLVPALAVRQDQQQPGPCDPTPCYQVIDSAACWSTVLMGQETNATKIFDCVPGGQEETLTYAARFQMCRCYGCDSILDKFVVSHQMCS